MAQDQIKKGCKLLIIGGSAGSLETVFALVTALPARMKEAIMQETASSSIESGQDWAVIRLDRPLGVYYGWLK